ncbi:MAG: C-GCAxxG-C-C family protein [Anaerolineae bacterium]
MSVKTEKALAQYASGFNCSQSVVSAFSASLGLDEQTALKLAGGFGGGLRCGEVCGAVTGAVMVIGLKYGQVAIGDVTAKENCSKITLDFINAYQARQSAVLCRELLGYDVRDDDAKARFPGKSKEVCPQAIAAAVALLEEMGF